MAPDTALSAARRAALGVLLAIGGCGSRTAEPGGATAPAPCEDVIYTVRPASWFEDVANGVRVAPDGRSLIYGLGPRSSVMQVTDGRASLDPTPAPAAMRTVFGPTGLVRLLQRDGAAIWVEDRGEKRLDLAADAIPVWSPDGRRLATFSPAARTAGVTVDGVVHAVPGNLLSIEWSPDGARLVTLTRSDDHIGSIGVLDLAGGTFRTVATDLDGDTYPAQFAVTPDGRGVVLALASTGAPDPRSRHDPAADRDLDLWRVDLTTGQRTLLVQAAGDDFSPSFADGHLYWMHAEVTPAVVVVPSAGGDARTLVSPGELPYWRPDGGQLAFTIGGWRLRDFALPLDAHVVDIDAEARPTGPPRPLITGFHEDFTPAWSPDGRWLAFHSHRSPTPVADYFGAGSTDDVWLALASAPGSTERRLTDIGHEAGMADWAPDGRRLAFASYDKASPGILRPYIVSVDTGAGRATGTTALRLPPGVTSTETLAWSPDGTTLAVESKTEGAGHALWLIDMASGAGRKLVEYPAATFGGVDWTPDGSRLIYGALVDDRMQLHAIDVRSGVKAQLTRAADGAFLPQVSPDGRWIAASSIRHLQQVKRMPWRPAPATLPRAS